MKLNKPEDALACPVARVFTKARVESEEQNDLRDILSDPVYSVCNHPHYRATWFSFNRLNTSGRPAESEEWGMTKTWTQWKLLIHVQLSSYDPNLEESVREAAELLSFIHKASSSASCTRTIVDLCYSCIWPDFKALHLLVQRIKCRFDNLAEFDLCIYRDGRARRLIWEHDNYMSIYDTTLKLHVSTASAAQYRSTLLAAWEASEYVDKVRSMWIDKDIQYPCRSRRARSYFSDPDYYNEAEYMDPYILEAGPFDAGW